jgi:hypothetical protein
VQSLLAKILVLIALPQIGLGMFGAGAFCITGGHAAVDCHDASPTDDCNQPAGEHDAPPIDHTCGHINTSHATAVSYSRADDALCIASWMPVWFDQDFVVAARVAVSLLSADDPPPAFCARAFSSLTALRC